jgi:uncharacterized membrane-anchored protein YhcB (DUF1043 family)
MDNIVCLLALLLGFAIGYLYVKFKSRNLLTLEKVKADYVLISIFEDHKKRLIDAENKIEHRNAELIELNRVIAAQEQMIDLHREQSAAHENETNKILTLSNQLEKNKEQNDIIENKLLKKSQDLEQWWEKYQKEHISVYGLHNDQRLTGAHETSSINEFSYGFSTRDTSIRIPAQAIVEGKGYFEDRRPASNCDPYQVSLMMLETVYSEVESEL